MSAGRRARAPREEPAAVITFVCPRCGYDMDAASSVAGEERVTPRAGDLTLCMKCGAPCELSAAAQPRWLTFDEVKALPAQARAQLTVALVAIVTMRPSAVRAVAYPKDAEGL